MERRSGDAHVTDAGRTVAPSASRRRSGVMSCPRPLLSSLFASCTKNSGWERAKDCSHLRASNAWVERNLPRHRSAYFFWVPYVYTSWTSLRRAAAVVTPPPVRIRRRLLSSARRGAWDWGGKLKLLPKRVFSPPGLTDSARSWRIPS